MQFYPYNSKLDLGCKKCEKKGKSEDGFFVDRSTDLCHDCWIAEGHGAAFIDIMEQIAPGQNIYSKGWPIHPFEPLAETWTCCGSYGVASCKKEGYVVVDALYQICSDCFMTMSKQENFIINYRPCYPGTSSKVFQPYKGTGNYKCVNGCHKKAYNLLVDQSTDLCLDCWKQKYEFNGLIEDFYSAGPFKWFPTVTSETTLINKFACHASMGGCGRTDINPNDLDTNLNICRSCFARLTGKDEVIEEGVAQVEAALQKVEGLAHRTGIPADQVQEALEARMDVISGKSTIQKYFEDPAEKMEFPKAVSSEVKDYTLANGMLDLIKFDSEVKDVLEDFNDLCYTIEAIPEGLLAKAIYRGGALTQVVVGDMDITEIAPSISGIPSSIKADDLSLIGTITIEPSNLKDLNKIRSENGLSEYGSITEAVNETLPMGKRFIRGRKIRFIVRDIADVVDKIRINLQYRELYSHDAAYSIMRELGLGVKPVKTYTSMKEIIEVGIPEALKNAPESTAMTALDIKVSDYKIRHELGNTSWGIRYSLKPYKRVEAKFVSLDLVTTPTGMVIPIVKTDHPEIQRAVLPDINAELKTDSVLTIDIFQEGAMPQVTGVTGKGKRIVGLTDKCGSCGSLLQNMKRLPMKICQNPHCKSKITDLAAMLRRYPMLKMPDKLETITNRVQSLGAFMKMTKEDMLDIPGVSEKLASDTLCLQNDVKYPGIVGLMLMTSRFSQEVLVELFGETTTFNEVLDTKLDYNKYWDVWATFMTGDLVKILRIFKNSGISVPYREPEALVSKEVPEEEAKAENKINGKVISFTGRHTTSKDDFAAMIYSVGGVISKRMSKKVNYLVVGDAPANGSLESATKYGTLTISEEELHNMLDEADKANNTGNSILSSEFMQEIRELFAEEA